MSWGSAKDVIEGYMFGIPKEDDLYVLCLILNEQTKLMEFKILPFHDISQETIVTCDLPEISIDGIEEELFPIKIKETLDKSTIWIG